MYELHKCNTLKEFVEYVEWQEERFDVEFWHRDNKLTTPKCASDLFPCYLICDFDYANYCGRDYLTITIVRDMSDLEEEADPLPTRKGNLK